MRTPCPPARVLLLPRYPLSLFRFLRCKRRIRGLLFSNDFHDILLFSLFALRVSILHLDWPPFFSLTSSPLCFPVMGMVESSLVSAVNGSMAFLSCILGSASCGAYYTVLLSFFLFICRDTVANLFQNWGTPANTGWVGLAWLRCGLVYTPSSAGSSFPIFSSSLLIPLLSRFGRQHNLLAGPRHVWCYFSPGFVWIMHVYGTTL